MTNLNTLKQLFRQYEQEFHGGEKLVEGRRFFNLLTEAYSDEEFLGGAGKFADWFKKKKKPLIDLPVQKQKVTMKPGEDDWQLLTVTNNNTTLKPEAQTSNPSTNYLQDPQLQSILSDPRPRLRPRPPPPPSIEENVRPETSSVSLGKPKPRPRPPPGPPPHIPHRHGIRKTDPPPGPPPRW